MSRTDFGRLQRHLTRWPATADVIRAVTKDLTPEQRAKLLLLATDRNTKGSR